jgi:uncharacterized protein (DUF2141 family)
MSYTPEMNYRTTAVIFWVSVILPVLCNAQNTLSIDVQGVKNSDGNISYAVYNQSEGFLKFDWVFRSDSTKAVKGTTRLVINDLPIGNYALAVFHDENNNRELDTNWLGIPSEDVGFSNSRMKTFGPPSFKECAIPLDSNSEITVTLE